LDPASTVQLHGPPVLVEAVVTAAPMGRQLAARDAAAILQ